VAIQKLGNEEVRKEVDSLKGWSLQKGKLHREYKFRDFIEAFGFMSRVALTAQSLDHHPEWSNVWNQVTIDLSTHSIGGISKLDVELASKIQELAGERD
jgi:4a-hydroxytetrahydrobiopterin dehydratase